MEPTGRKSWSTYLFWIATINVFVSTAVYMSLCAMKTTEVNQGTCHYIEGFTVGSVVAFVAVVLWHCFKLKMKNDAIETYLHPLPIFADESEFRSRGRSHPQTSRTIELREFSILDPLPNEDIPEDFECAICSEHNNDEPVSKLSCEHLFHRKCILKWFKADSQKTCPICRNSQNSRERLLVITIVPQPTGTLMRPFQSQPTTTPV